MGKLKIFGKGNRWKGKIIQEIIDENPIISAENIIKKIRRKGYKIKGIKPEYEVNAIGNFINQNLLNKSVGRFRYVFQRGKLTTVYYPLKN